MIELALEQALKKSRVNQRTAAQAKGSRRTIMRSHGFRKFAITMMDKAGVKYTHRRYLTGHAQVGQDASYVLPTEEALLAEYIKAIDLLTIDPTRRLKKQIRQLETKYSEEWGALKKEVNEQTTPP
jgi:superfamily II DNA/RNA helicase